MDSTVECTLGATVVDLVDNPLANCGLALGGFAASAVMAAVMIGCILAFRQRSGLHPGQDGMAA